MYMLDLSIYSPMNSQNLLVGFSKSTQTCLKTQLSKIIFSEISRSSSSRSARFVVVAAVVVEVAVVVLKVVVVVVVVGVSW